MYISADWSPVAESMTGGHVLERLTGPPGASDVVRGGVVVYATETKTSVIGVGDTVISEHGVVSEPVAAAMAAGVRATFGADVGVSITGVAGPGPAGGVDQGTVCIGIEGPGGARTTTIRLPGDRERVRRYGATAALHQVLRALGDTFDLSLMDAFLPFQVVISLALASLTCPHHDHITTFTPGWEFR